MITSTGKWITWDLNSSTVFQWLNLPPPTPRHEVLYFWRIRRLDIKGWMHLLYSYICNGEIAGKRAALTKGNDSLMESTWLRRAFKLEDIGCSLTWRSLLAHPTWITLRLSIQVCLGKWIGAHQLSDLTTTSDYENHDHDHDHYSTVGANIPVFKTLFPKFFSCCNPKKSYPSTCEIKCKVCDG